MIEILLALLGGAVLTVQIGVNGSLRAVLGSPLWATFTSFLVGTVFLGALGAVTRAELPKNFHAPLWMWTGGALGAVYVFLSVFLASRLSASTFVACIVGGQMMASLVVDHFGWLGFAQHAISPMRVGGALLLGAAIWMLKNG